MFEIHIAMFETHITRFEIQQKANNKKQNCSVSLTERKVVFFDLRDREARSEVGKNHFERILIKMYYLCTHFKHNESSL